MISECSAIAEILRDGILCDTEHEKMVFCVMRNIKICHGGH